MVLDPTLRLEVVLAGNHSTTALDVHVVYRNYQADGIPSIPVPARAVTNNSTDVVVLAAPAGTIKVSELERLSVYNRDVSTHIVTLKTDDAAASTERIITRVTLLTLETLCWEKNAGWQVLP